MTAFCLHCGLRGWWRASLGGFLATKYSMRFRSNSAHSKAFSMQSCAIPAQSKTCMGRIPWQYAVGLRPELRRVCCVTSTRQEPVTATPPAKFSQLDYTQIAALASELQQWLPSKVQRVQLADPHTLALYIRAIDRQGWLHLSWHPRAARVCLGDDPEYIEASSLYPFAQLVRTKCATHLLFRACRAYAIRFLHPERSSILTRKMHFQ